MSKFVGKCRILAVQRRKCVGKIGGNLWIGFLMFTFLFRRIVCRVISGFPEFPEGGLEFGDVGVRGCLEEMVSIFSVSDVDVSFGLRCRNSGLSGF